MVRITKAKNGYVVNYWLAGDQTEIFQDFASLMLALKDIFGEKGRFTFNEMTAVKMGG